MDQGGHSYLLFHQKMRDFLAVFRLKYLHSRHTGSNQCIHVAPPYLPSSPWAEKHFDYLSPRADLIASVMTEEKVCLVKDLYCDKILNSPSQEWVSGLFSCGSLRWECHICRYLNKEADCLFKDPNGMYCGHE